MFKKLVVIVPIVALMASAAAAQNAPAPPKPGDPELKRLLQLMDVDHSGQVSRSEFMTFMQAEFDRLDVNRDGQLNISELNGMQMRATHPGGAGSR